jgi:hypothetical protein
MEKLGWILLVALTSWLGSFIGSYSKKKGENLATKEDFRELKAQTAELRQATKEIESKIEDQVWDRQRQWELKRDAVLGVIQSLSDSEDALMCVCVFYQLLTKDDSKPANEAYEKALLDWKDKITGFESKRTLAKLMCGEEFNTALRSH